MSETDDQIAEVWRRLNRIEAAMDEIAKGFSLYKNDKAYDERTRNKERKL